MTAAASTSSSTTTSIGLVMTEHIVAGRLTGWLGQQKLEGERMRYPADVEESEALIGVPKGELYEVLCSQIVPLIAGAGGPVAAIGVAVPGIVRNGVVEDSPNLAQIKGVRLADALGEVLKAHKASSLPSTCSTTPTQSPPDSPRPAAISTALSASGPSATASATAAGPRPTASGRAATRSSRSTQKSAICGCGGVGHIEGIMGNRAMRLRFLDLEPEEVFANAKAGDQRCREFVDLWHRALAAGTASAIHLGGPGKFYFTGLNVDYLELQVLRGFLEGMVKMSPLQSYSLEVLKEDDGIGILGAGVAAMRAQSW